MSEMSWASILSYMAALHNYWWTRSYKSFLEAKGIKKDSQKLALLLYCARQDVQDIFATLSDPGSGPEEETQNAEALKLLDAHFPLK